MTIRLPYRSKKSAAVYLAECSGDSRVPVATHAGFIRRNGSDAMIAYEAAVTRHPEKRGVLARCLLTLQPRPCIGALRREGT